MQPSAKHPKVMVTSVFLEGKGSGSVVVCLPSMLEDSTHQYSKTSELAAGDSCSWAQSCGALLQVLSASFEIESMG